MKKNVYVFFISGHGFGHMSRMRHVLKKLESCLSHKDEIFVFSSCNQKFFSSLSIKKTKFFPLTHDVGLCQKDSLTVDFDKTIFKLKQVCNEKKKTLKKVLKVIDGFNVKSIMSDTSWFGGILGEYLSIPSLLIGNFTWTDIYKDLAKIDERFTEYIVEINKYYHKTTRCLVLPMNTKMEPFSLKDKESIPFLLSENIKMPKGEFLKLTRLKKNDSRKKILLSFGGFDLDYIPFKKFKKYEDDYVFITTRVKTKRRIENLIEIPLVCNNYGGLIKNCDIVLTKPGYGIIADCIVHKRPIIYTSRGRFAEYNVLKKWLNHNFPSAYISNRKFFNGDFDKVFDEIKTTEKKYPTLSKKGSSVVVEKLIT